MDPHFIEDANQQARLDLGRGAGIDFAPRLSPREHGREQDFEELLALADQGRRIGVVGHQLRRRISQEAALLLVIGEGLLNHQL